MSELARIYRVGYRLGLASLPKKAALQILLEPCTYWRNVEVPSTLKALNTRSGERILDVGSPKLLSLFLASQYKSEVWATDLFPYFLEDCRAHSENLHVKENYHPELQDARKLTYESNYFDKIYAISVIEHIENDGDSVAIRELARVLKPGGLCCLTFPVAPIHCDMHTKVNLYYKSHEENKPVFWQRKYDPRTLQERLVMASGMEVAHLSYFGEKAGYESFYESLPKLAKIALAPFGVLASKLFLYPMEIFGPKAKTAILVLKKPAAQQPV